jgi:hypothetical protein
VSDELLDPEEFPFTEEELLQAASLWLGEGDARLLSEQITQSAHDFVNVRAEQLQRGFPPRSSFPGELSQLRICGFIQIEWLWPALSVISELCGARVVLWMRDHWRTEYLLKLARAKTDAAFASGHYLPHDEAVERMRAEDADVSWIRPDMELRYPHVPLPDATEAMQQTATARVEEQRQAWLALAAESQRRLDARHAPSGSLPPTPPRP